MTTHKKHPQSTSESTFGGADAVPTDNAPAPPTGFTLQKLGRGSRPAKATVQAATQAAEEIRTATTYESTFGSLAPSAAPLADAINFAAEWSAKRASAEAWRTYTRQQEDLAWRFALGKLGHQPVLEGGAALCASFGSRAQGRRVEEGREGSDGGRASGGSRATDDGHAGDHEVSGHHPRPRAARSPLERAARGAH